MKRRAVFLDRDGTINEDVGYPYSFEQIKIFPYSFEAVRKIKRAGFLAVIITNQSGIGRGFLTEENLEDIHQKLQGAFASQAAPFDGIYYCPHYEQSLLPQYRKNCTCRKPEIGLALQAAQELSLDLKNSYMIGDKTEDVLFGRNIQATSILVLTGFGEQSLQELRRIGIKPPHTAQNLLQAVNWMLKKEHK